MSYKQQLVSWRDEDINYLMGQLKSRARSKTESNTFSYGYALVIAFCFDDLDQQRRFVIKLHEYGMDDDEYVYIMPDPRVRNRRFMASETSSSVATTFHYAIS